MAKKKLVESAKKVTKAKFTFSNTPTAFNHDMEISWDMLPKGDYFYHYTSPKSLTSIRRIGLVPFRVHKRKRNFLDIGRPDRVFFFAAEADCLDWLNMKFSPRKPAILRVNRTKLSDCKLYHDPEIYYQYPDANDKVYSFSANCKVQPKDIEICSQSTDKKCLKWSPITKR